MSKLFNDDNITTCIDKVADPTDMMAVLQETISYMEELDKQWEKDQAEADPKLFIMPKGCHYDMVAVPKSVSKSFALICESVKSSERMSFERPELEMPECKQKASASGGLSGFLHTPYT